MRNNPHNSNVTINQHALESLHIDGVPSDIMTVESENDILSDEVMSPDLGPSSDNIEDKVYNMRQQKRVALCQPVKNRKQK